MCSPLHFRLLALILVNHILLIIALPTAATLSFLATIANNNSEPLTSVSFSQTVAQGIAAAQRAYPNIVPRLYSVVGQLSGAPQGLPFMVETIILQLHIAYPKAIRLAYPDRWGSSTWTGPVERDDPTSFDRPAINWAQSPLSFEEAQLKISAAQNIPSNRKGFNSVAVNVSRTPHPTLPIAMGELVYIFANRNAVHGGFVWLVFVVARTGEVFLQDDEEAAVQTT